MAGPTKKCAVINDFSGFGRCSLTVALPVLSAMGVQCCSVPTAVLSNHTGYPNYFFDSYTDKMPAYINEWKKLSLEFDSIFSGFLGCEEQIDIVVDFINNFSENLPIIIVDPVMGDNGKIYTTYTEQMCEKMRHLVKMADVITPNITEACILAGEQYRGEEIGDNFARELLLKLCDGGKKSVILTGVIDKDNICTYVFDKDSADIFVFENARIDTAYPGTGDLFASVLCGAVTNGVSLLKAAEFASKFVKDTTLYTSQFDTNPCDGIAFEPYIDRLCEFSKKGDFNE